MVREKTGIWAAVGPEEEDGKRKCKYCPFRYAANATRIRHHLTGGSGFIQSCQGVIEQGELPSVVAEAIEDATASRSKKRSRQDNSKNLVDLFGGTSKDAADIAIAELFVACGIPRFAL
jgi:hypothetical protein